MAKTKIPYYYQAIDWNNFVKEYPPPAEFEKTVYRWSRDKIEKLKEEKFKKVIEFGWKNPFYKSKWTEAGIEPQDIRSLDDLHKLPIVTVFDFKAAINANPPFGDHQGIWTGVDAQKPLKIQASGGTTGKPRPTFFGPIEWEMNGIGPARSMYIQGAGPGDVLQIPTTAYTANFAWSFYYAAHAWLGMVPVTSGSGVVTPTLRQIELAQDWGTNTWAAFPEYLGHIANVARKELAMDIRDLNTKAIFTFLGPDHSGKLRRELEELWGCDVFDNYGTHEIGMASFECKEKAGLHFQEDMGIAEVVDPDTNDPVDINEQGDLVYTCFWRQHPPIIRYNLKDLVRFVDHGQKCGCGSWMLRMDHFLGRSDDMVKLRGTNLYPMACLDAVKSDDRSTGEWICVVDTVGEGADARDEMVVKVEYNDESIDKENFKQKMEKKLRNDLGVRVVVEPVPANSLAELTGYGGEKKVRRLLDNRSAAI